MNVRSDNGSNSSLVLVFEHVVAGQPIQRSRVQRHQRHGPGAAVGPTEFPRDRPFDLADQLLPSIAIRHDREALAEFGR